MIEVGKLLVNLLIDTSKFDEAMQKLDGAMLNLKNVKAILELKKLLRVSEQRRIKQQYEPKTFIKYPSDGLQPNSAIIDELHEYRG